MIISNVTFVYLQNNVIVLFELYENFVFLDDARRISAFFFWKINLTFNLTLNYRDVSTITPPD